jgi:hypothetical protein
MNRDVIEIGAEASIWPDENNAYLCRCRTATGEEYTAKVPKAEAELVLLLKGSTPGGYTNNKVFDLVEKYGEERVRAAHNDNAESESEMRF